MSLELSDAVVVEGQLQLGEFLRFNYWFMWRRFKLFVVLIVLVLVYALLAGLGVFGPRSEGAGGIDWRFFIWPSVAAAVVLTTYFSAKRAFANNKLLSQPVRFTFSSSGIEVNGPISSGKCSWEGIQSGEETRSMFLLWISKQQAYLLPKRYFTEQSVESDFRTLITNQLGSRARLRSGA